MTKQLTELANYCLTGINKDIQEGEKALTGNMKETFIDLLISENEAELDLDGYDFVMSENKPKVDKSRYITADVVIGKSEIYLDNTTGEELTGQTLEEVKACLPKYVKYIWSDKEKIAFRTSYFKDTRPYLVMKVGYKGPVDATPVEVDAELSNGYRVMRLLTSDEIKTEGRHLGHCVGRADMGYIDKAMKGDIQLYSLRGPTGEGLLTIECKDEQVIQIKGNKNRLPGFGPGASSITKIDEVRAIVEWLELRKVNCNSVMDLAPAILAIGFRVGADGKL